MSTRPEFVGTIHIFLGRCRGNPIALYLRKEGDVCSISPRMSPWNQVVGVGETPNKAAADFDAKWKAGDVAPEMYSGPHWEGGIKPEKPKPPPKQPPPAPAPVPVPPQAGSTVAAPAPGPLVARGAKPAPGFDQGGMLDQGESEGISIRGKSRDALGHATTRWRAINTAGQ